jgi:hypothetical protein
MPLCELAESSRVPPHRVCAARALLQRSNRLFTASFSMPCAVQARRRGRSVSFRWSDAGGAALGSAFLGRRRCCRPRAGTRSTGQRSDGWRRRSRGPHAHLRDGAMRIAIAEDMALMQGPRPAADRSWLRPVGGPRTPRSCSVSLHLRDLTPLSGHQDAAHPYRRGTPRRGRIRERYPRDPVLLLQLPRRPALRQPLEATQPVPATRPGNGSRCGCLSDAPQRLHRGDAWSDPAIVNRLLNRAREPGPLDELSPRGGKCWV